MPEPKPGEKRVDYIQRCIPIVKDEGKTTDQAIAQCHGMWRQSKEKGNSE